MVSDKDAVSALLKYIAPTASAASLSLTSKNISDSFPVKELIFEGEKGAAKLRVCEDNIELICNKSGEEKKNVASVLFETHTEDWSLKDCKSAANELSEAISAFFSTPLIYESQENKKSDARSAELTEAAPKKKKKESTVSYEAENLAYRMENIFPELRGEAESLTEKYNIFLPDEYFESKAVPLIMDALRRNDRQTKKKLFNAFNIFYDEGSKDVQSLIAVSVLGTKLLDEPELLDGCSEFMSEELSSAVLSVIAYLKTPSGKAKLKRFHEPVAYKAKKLR